MFIIVIIWLLMLLCAVKTIGYGIYTFRSKNTAGGVGLLVLAALSAAAVLTLV